MIVGSLGSIVAVPCWSETQHSVEIAANSLQFSMDRTCNQSA
ncbi:hypothetical protein RESH_06222 [Rhodopirellula europaea SH398]|uniref:Uncharacterized protein n=1 Tax=Rhodopirellula europaea SH398 TaxID=1263868 RepID=M5RV13_9BACT|nr:hypothetical protein RESH_06222 [Rhodopirellula europaea SH398]